MSSCDCANFEPIELKREYINQRAKQSKALRSRLILLAEHSGSEHRLYRCDSCGQLWQRSLAWNWGNKEYLFRVPAIDPSEWQTMPFVQPDELLIFAGVMGRFYKEQSFEETDKPCRETGCMAKSVRFSVHCRKHHIADLQRIHQLPASPTGRWFDPYREDGFLLP